MRSGQPHYLGHRERLRARLLAGGAEPLADYELLEFLLFSGHPRGDMKPLAKSLLERFGSLPAVLAAENEALLRVPGMGAASVAALKAAREAGLRMLRAEVRERPVISSWQKLVEYCTATIGFGSVEQFRLLFLDRKNALIADEAQQEGTIDHTPVYPREVAKRALELGASAIIMVHNHCKSATGRNSSQHRVTLEIAELRDSQALSSVRAVASGRRLFLLNCYPCATHDRATQTAEREDANNKVSNTHPGRA